VSSIEEMILPLLDFALPAEKWRYLSATEVLQAIGFQRPTNPQCRECGAALQQASRISEEGMRCDEMEDTAA